MKESYELIQTTLSFAGELLSFTGFALKGIPGFDISMIRHGESSAYITERQEFSFQLSTQDCKTNSIALNQVFTYSDDSYTYTFKINRPPIADLTGWSQVYCILTSVT